MTEFSTALTRMSGTLSASRLHRPVALISTPTRHSPFLNCSSLTLSLHILDSTNEKDLSDEPLVEPGFPCPGFRLFVSLPGNTETDGHTTSPANRTRHAQRSDDSPHGGFPPWLHWRPISDSQSIRLHVSHAYLPAHIGLPAQHITSHCDVRAENAVDFHSLRHHGVGLRRSLIRPACT